MSIISEIVDDDMEEWNKQDDYYVSREETYAYAQDVVAKIADALGAKFTMKTFIPYIS